MTLHPSSPIANAEQMVAFGPEARAAFAAAYPDRPVQLTHGLAGHPLLDLPALAALAERMPADRRRHGPAIKKTHGVSFVTLRADLNG